MSSKFSYTIILSIFIIFCAKEVYGNGETLVLLDSLAIKETHSIFFKSLQGKNYLVFIFFTPKITITIFLCFVNEPNFFGFFFFFRTWL